jgi:hypothetical protein
MIHAPLSGGCRRKNIIRRLPFIDIKKQPDFTAGSLKYGWVTFVISSIIIKSRFSVKTEPDKSIKKEGGMCEEIVNFL